MNKSADTNPNCEKRDILNPKQLKELQGIIDRLRKEITAKIKGPV